MSEGSCSFVMIEIDGSCPNPLLLYFHPLGRSVGEYEAPQSINNAGGIGYRRGTGGTPTDVERRQWDFR